MRIKKKEIHNIITFLFLLYPSFRCIGYEMANLGTATPSYIRIWAVCSMICSFFLLQFKHKLEMVDFPIYLYCGYMLLLSLYMKTTGQEVAFTSLVSYITTFIGTIYCTKKFKQKVINYFFILFAGLFLIEGLSMFLLKDGFFMQNSVLTFIGHVQIYSMLWTCLAVFSLLQLEELRRSWEAHGRIYKRIIIYGLCIIGTIISLFFGVIATKIAMIVFFITYLVFKYKKINQSKWLMIIFFLAMALNVLVVFLNFQEQFASLLGSFGEDTSLNGRTYIWSLFIPEISKSPLIGHGYKVFGVVLSNWGHNNIMDYCHNTLLQEIMHGGLIQLGLFIFLNVYAIRRLRMTTNVRIQHALFCGLCALYVIMISESVTYYNYWNVMISIVVNANNLGMDSFHKKMI